MTRTEAAYLGLLALLLAGMVGTVELRPDLLKPQEPVTMEQPARQTGNAPAPTVRRVMKGKNGMPDSYGVSGSGDATYDGTYTPISGGWSNGSRYLYYHEATFTYCLGTVLGEDPMMGHVAYNSLGPLPGTWEALDSPPYSGTPSPPAPTVTAISPIAAPSTFNWPYTFHFWSGGGFYPPATPYRPTLCTIDGAEYVAFPYASGLLTAAGITLCALSDWSWQQCPMAADLFPLNEYDPYQTGALFDLGSDTLGATSGAWLDGSQWKFSWNDWAIVPGTSATAGTAQDVNLPADGHMSTWYEVSTGVYRFVVKDGTAYKLCQYSAGDATYSEVQTMTGTNLPPGMTAYTTRRPVNRRAWFSTRTPAEQSSGSGWPIPATSWPTR